MNLLPLIEDAGKLLILMRSAWGIHPAPRTSFSAISCLATSATSFPRTKSTSRRFLPWRNCGAGSLTR